MHFTFNRVLVRASTLLVAFNPTKLPLCPPVMSSHVATGHYDRRGRRRRRQRRRQRRRRKGERDKEYRERDELSSQLHSNITSAPMISSRSFYSLIDAHVIIRSYFSFLFSRSFRTLFLLLKCARVILIVKAFFATRDIIDNIEYVGNE